MITRKITLKQWKQEGQSKFGEDSKQWKFICPSCKHVASVQDYIDAGAVDGEIGFSCIGRNLGIKKSIGDKTGGPCNYAGGGLFQLNPVKVILSELESVRVFEFAEVKPD